MRPSRCIRFASVGLAVLVAATAACSDASTGPSAVNAVDVAIPAAFSTVTQACTGAAFYFEPSRIHLKLRADRDRAGGFHVSVHESSFLNGKDARGTEYQSARESRNYTLTTREVPRDPQPDQFQIVETEVSQVHLIAKGIQPDFRLHITYHVTININTATLATDASAEVADVSGSCGGLGRGY